MTEVYLVRHGQSVHNQSQTIAGQLDSELTVQGVEDARFVAGLLGRTDIDLIYSSDLRRARQTAETIVEVLNLASPVRLTPLLRELDYGEFTNQPVAETFEFLNYKVLQDRRYPSGESFRDMEQRLGRFLRQLQKEDLGKTVLITAHAGSIRMMMILFDPGRRQQYLNQTFSNRYLGRVVLDGNGKLARYEALHNGSEGF